MPGSEKHSLNQKVMDVNKHQFLSIFTEKNLVSYPHTLPTFVFLKHGTASCGKPLRPFLIRV
jgi:hypothetical protein